MALRQCSVSYLDLSGIKHTVEVTADSLYEAVAQGLSAFQANDWVGDIPNGHAMITVVVAPPTVEHQVRVRDFERWLAAPARSPAEMSFKSRIRELLGKSKGRCADDLP